MGITVKAQPFAVIQLPLVKNTSGSLPVLAFPAAAVAGEVVEAADLLPVPSPIAASPLAQGSGFTVLAAVGPVRSPSSVKPYEVAIDAVGERVEQ